jgi:hypothetical protein
MKLLIQAVAILLLVSSCDKESNEPAPLEQTQQAEQAEQKEPDKQANQVERQESTSKPAETPYQRAIRAKIKGSSKDKDSSDEKDG